MTATQIQKIYLLLLLFTTLAASLIWGVNTLFLLDAGLSNTQAFAANAFFTVGQVIFEVPTGMVADTWGRRLSFLLGTLTLAVSTLLYFWAWQVHAEFWVWAVTSIILGLGFTFFSGATEAWLVDALHSSGYKGTLESVFAKGQIISGVAMLTGSVAGGFLAQASNLGLPYILRAAILGITFVLAFLFMKDLGFVPKPRKKLTTDIKNLFTTSINLSLRKPSLRWVMLAAPLSTGVGFYAFYAMQPYLLELYGDQKAYAVAGLAAAILAGAQIIGGFMVPYIKFVFHRRTTVLLTGIVFSSILLILISFSGNFWLAILLLIFWGLSSAAVTPVRQAYINGLISSDQRATVLSFDSLLGSSGGVIIQPILGKVADVGSYAFSYVIAGIFQILALPFILFARKQKAKSDVIAP